MREWWRGIGGVGRVRERNGNVVNIVLMYEIPKSLYIWMDIRE